MGYFLGSFFGGYFGQFWAILGHFWGDFGQFLGTSGAILGDFGQFWAILGNFGQFFGGRPISLSLNTGSGSGYVLVSLRAYASAGRLCARFTARIRRPSLARRCIAVRRSKLPTDFVWREIIRSAFRKTMT